MVLESDRFPNETELQRITTLRKYDKLYENEAQSVLGIHDIIKKQFTQAEDLVYLAHAIPARISDFYGDFIQGDDDRIIIRAKPEAEKKIIDFVENTVYKNDLKEQVYDYGVTQSQYGFFVLLGSMVGEDYNIDMVGQDQYFPQPDGSVIFMTYKKNPSDVGNKRLLAYIQHYHLEGDNVIIDRSAWTTNEQGVINERYDLSAMAKLLRLPNIDEQDKIEGLGTLPIRQIDNSKKTKYGFGKSDYNDVMPQLAEVNERATHISTVLLKNLDSKMILPESAYDEEGKPKRKESYVLQDKEEVKPEYVINNSPFISETREHIIQQTQWISLITGVPMFEILKGSMPERVESLRMQMFSAIRKTNTKRSKIKRGLNDMFRIGFRIANLQYDSDIDIEMSDVLPTDELQVAETEQIKINSGISSRKSSMKRIENYSDTEAEREFEEINSEDKIAGIGEGGSAPTI